MTAKKMKTTKKPAKAPMKAAAKTKAKMAPKAKQAPRKPVKQAKPMKAAPAKKAVAKAVPSQMKAAKSAPKAPAHKMKAAPAKKPVAVAKAAPAAKAPVAKNIVSKPTVIAAPKPAIAKVTMKPLAAAPAPMQRPMVPQARHNMMRPAAMNPMQLRQAAAAARPANDTPVDFRSGDYVVYPAHGVGTIEGIETQTIAGMTVTLYAITFEKDRMRLKIPVQKAQTAGLRKLSSGDRLKDALKTLQGKAKIKRTMWSRRAQEYEAKINSGDPVQIAEVLRDLRRPKDDTEQSYSERQIYQSALERLAREVAAVQRIAETKAVEHLETVLSQAA